MRDVGAAALSAFTSLLTVHLPAGSTTGTSAGCGPANQRTVPDRPTNQVAG